MRILIFLAVSSFVFVALHSQPSFASFECQGFSDGEAIWVDVWDRPENLQDRAECECASGRAKRISKVRSSQGRVVKTYTAQFVCLKGPGHQTSPIDFGKLGN